MRLHLLESSIDFGFLFFLFLTLFTSSSGLNSVQYKSCSACIQQKNHFWCEPTNHTLAPKNASCKHAVTVTPSSGNCKAIYPEQKLLVGAPSVADPSEKPAYNYAHVLSSIVGGDRSPRIGDQLVLNFTFTDVDKALDVYYLLDCTKSMSKHRNQVISQGETLKKVFQDLNVTSNYQIGLGTFVDKVVVPFGSFKSEYESRMAEYTFKNNMRLEPNVAKFIHELSEVKNYTSLDDPEATLEALMQVLACKDVIGWRPDATKIVIVATDQPFHKAGMGRLAGIVRPNDENCHTDSNGTYNEWSKQDYPSINQIARAINRTGINVLFAVGSAQFDTNSPIENCTEGYRKLKDSLNSKLERHSGAAHHVHMVELEDKAGIVEVLSNTYRKIRSEIRFFHQLQGFTAEQEYRTSVTYDFNCGGQNWVFDRPRVECANVTAGVTIQFAIKIPIDAELCKTAEAKKIRIFQSGELTSVGIDINPICRCSCENQKIIDSSLCAGNGDFVCGVCECKDGFNGTDCSCRKTDNKRNCEEHVGGATVVCSNNGECKCGKCICKEGFSGKLCEFNCDQCFEHGKCENGGCICNEDFIGTFCQCRNNDTSCKNPITEEICGLSEAGRGQCLCSDENLSSIPRNQTVPKSCKCPDDYTGTFCEVCQSAACRGPSSTSNSGSDPDLFGVCSDEGLRRLVTGVHEIGRSDVSECQSVAGWKTLVQVEWGPEAPNMGYCFFVNAETECSFGYWYAFKDTKCLLLRTHDTARNCPDVSIWYIIGGTVGGILFAGIVALIIWKICIYFQDKREWEQFNQNLENINWVTSGNNKLFKSALTTTVNPIFGNNRMSRLFNRKSMMMPNEIQ